MVTIPVAPSVQPTAPQGPQFQAFSPTPVQNVAGQQLRQLGRATFARGIEAMRKEAEEQEKIDRSLAREASSLAGDLDRDKDLAFHRKRGKEAVDDYDQHVQDFHDRTKEFSSNLTGRQLEAFMVMREEQEDRFLGRAGTHKSNQIVVQDVAANAASRDGMVNDYIAGVSDSLDGAVGEARLLAQKLGQDPQGAVKDMTTRAHAGRLSQMIADSINTPAKLDEASAYLKANRDQMDPTVATKFQGQLDRAIKSKSLGEQSLRLSTETIAAVRNEASKTEALSFYDRVNELYSQGRADEATDMILDLDPDIPTQVSPARLAIEGEKRLRDRFNKGEISAELYQQTSKQYAADVARLVDEESVNGVEAFKRLQVWLDEDQTRPLGSFPEIDKVIESGMYAQAKAYARNARVVTDPQARFEMANIPDAEWAVMTEAQFMGRFFGRLEDQHLNVGLAKLAGRQGRASQKQLQLIKISDLNEEFARKWGIDPEDEKDGGRYTQMLIRLQEFAGQLPSDATLDQYRDLVLKPAGNQLVEAPDQDAWLWGTKQQPLVTVSEEAQADAVVRVAGEAVKLSDITRDARRVLEQEAWEAGDLPRGVRIDRNTDLLAKMWVAGGKLRPYAGVPGSEVATSEGIVMDKAQVLDDAQGALLNAKNIPQDVLRDITRRMAFPPQAHSVARSLGRITPRAVKEVTPSDIWNEWVKLGRPMNVEAAQAARGRL